MKFLLIIFCLACSGYTTAQTTVCSGDSVVLVLTGYKQGDILWKQSSDKATWSNATATQSHDSLFLVATNTYYYRAIVNDGTCSPFYSDTMLVIVNPSPPIAKPATGITQTGFTANWSTVAGATDYFLDVATDLNFTSFVPTYENVDVGNTDTTYPIGGLSCHTPYYYRVRDTSDGCPNLSANSNTITATTDSCPPPVCSGSITDTRDGNVYKIIAIGEQCWMAQNLNVGKRIDGIMPQTQYDSLGVNTIEKYCYDNLEANCTTYGGLYMWDEMMNYTGTVSGDKGPKGICLTGWHIPTDDEWSILETYLGGATVAGRKLKDTTNWTSYSDATKGTNSSGFTTLPSSNRDYDGSFYPKGYLAYFWSATEDPANGASGAWSRYLHYSNANVYRGSAFKVRVGFSVRCLKG